MKRGLLCAKCGRSLNTRRVATSYPIENGGHRRTYYCDCGAENATIEWVVGVKAGPMVLVTGLDKGKRNGAQQAHVQAVKSLAESFGGTVTRL